MDEYHSDPARAEFYHDVQSGGQSHFGVIIPGEENTSVLPGLTSELPTEGLCIIHDISEGIRFIEETRDRLFYVVFEIQIEKKTVHDEERERKKRNDEILEFVDQLADDGFRRIALLVNNVVALTGQRTLKKRIIHRVEMRRILFLVDRNNVAALIREWLNGVLRKQRSLSPPPVSHARRGESEGGFRS